MSTVRIYTVDQAAELLGCSAKTVEDLARRGELPGIKPGGGWVFPAGALAQRLDELALQDAARRRSPAAAPQPAAMAMQPTDKPRRAKPPRALPALVDLSGTKRPAC